MDEKEEAIKPPRIYMKGKIPKLTIGGINLEEIKRHPTVHVSPRGPVNSTKPLGARPNCLCSPTTHAGSFRCRHHRVGGMKRGGSVGSNLSLLDNSKPQTNISDSLQPQ